MQIHKKATQRREITTNKHGNKGNNAQVTDYKKTTQMQRWKSEPKRNNYKMQNHNQKF